jgi:SNF2 family DNA or RNA helicase
MEQWAEEIRKKTAPGRLKVTTHHGTARTKGGSLTGDADGDADGLVGQTLERYDVVITTYQTLASEFGNPAGANSRAAADSDGDDTESSERVRKPKAKVAGRALFDVKWLRVVLGEAVTRSATDVQTRPRTSRITTPRRPRLQWDWWRNIAGVSQGERRVQGSADRFRTPIQVGERSCTN